jgi:cytidylate kinase
MAIVILSGEPGCRVEEVARLLGQKLRFPVVGEATVREWIAREFGSEVAVPDRAWPALVSSLVATLGLEGGVVITVPGAELLFGKVPGVLRAHLDAPEAWRVGALLLEHRMTRDEAKQLALHLLRERRAMRSRCFGRTVVRPSLFDLTLNCETLDSEPLAELIAQAAAYRGMDHETRLPAAVEAQIQFQMRLRLAKYGITPPAPDKNALWRKPFANPSEEIFANLLNFYRIAYEYEPRSFPVQWDKDGRVLEAFTPDFYLPEFDLYVELTTMKQAHVTKKNRKVKLLRQLYPEIRIQVFYQKDFRNLIFKHGLEKEPVLA